MKTLFRCLFVASSLITVGLHGADVRFIYLSPSDKPFRPEHKANIEHAARSLQTWFVGQLGRSMILHEPTVVEWHQTSHPVSWYQTNPLNPAYASGRFWESTLADGFALTGGGYNDPKNRWIFYIDADILPGQSVGGTSGVAVMPANDLRGLNGEPIVPINPGDSSVNPGVNRWIGGAGHELGHALGLDHPPGCPSGGEFSDSLMCLGYVRYPATYLRDVEKAALLATPFFQSRSIYVDGSYTGIVQDGSPAMPYSTLSQGMAAAQNGDTLRVRTGIYNSPPTLGGKVLRIETVNGPVNIRRSSQLTAGNASQGGLADRVLGERGSKSSKASLGTQDEVSAGASTRPRLGLKPCECDPESGLGPDLMFEGAPEVVYRIDVSEDLKSWITLTNRPGANVPVRIEDPMAGGTKSRFYRVEETGKDPVNPRQ